MNPNAPFERDLEEWLHTEAPASAPTGFHATVMDRARTLRQRPGWTRTFPARRFGRGRGMTLLAAAALLGGGALAAGSGILRLPSVVPPVPAPSVVAIATASPDATSPSPSESAAPSAAPDPSAFPRTSGTWIATGSMGTAHDGRASAVRLLDGRVLVVGGDYSEDDPPSDPSSAELYDPDTGTWTATGAMLRPGYGFAATLLRDGRVLAGDGAGAEVYDPASGTWAATGTMVNANPGAATLLHDGRVLVTGSGGGSSQVYDPLSGMWTSTGKMATPSFGHAATLLPDGKVLVVGGQDGNNGAFASAELYDPATGTWTAIAPMHAARGSITATLLPDGKVLVVGSSFREPPTPPEVYDPATGTWTVLGDPAGPGTSYPSATLLSDGTVLLTDAPNAALYDPGTGSWTATGTMPSLRRGTPPSVLLLDGTVLVAGGSECTPAEMDGNREVPGSECTVTSSAELYVPAGVSPPPAVLALPSGVTTPSPSPTPTPTPVPPQAGPVPPGARTWKVTVMNKSSQPATLFVAEENERGDMGPLVGSANPNVVPPGATVKVTFLVPAKGTGWVIFVNPPAPIGGPLVGPAEMSRPVQILIMEDGQPTHMSP